MINVKLSTAKERRCCLSRFGVTLCSRATPHQFDAMQLTVTIFVFVVCGVRTVTRLPAEVNGAGPGAVCFPSLSMNSTSELCRVSMYTSHTNNIPIFDSKD